MSTKKYQISYFLFSLLAFLVFQAITPTISQAATSQTKTIEDCKVEFSILGPDGKKLAAGASLDRAKEYTARFTLVGPVIDCALFKIFEFGYVKTETATAEDKKDFPSAVSNGKVTAKYTQLCYSYNEFKVTDAGARYVETALNDSGSDTEVWKYFFVSTKYACGEAGARQVWDYGPYALFLKAPWLGKPTATNTNANSNSSNSNTGTVPDTNVGASLGSLDDTIGRFFNPLDKETLPELMASVLRILFALIGMLAVIVIIVAGFRMVLSSGDPTGVANAKKAITAAIVGLVLSLMAFSIVAIVQRLIQG